LCEVYENLDEYFKKYDSETRNSPNFFMSDMKKLLFYFCFFILSSSLPVTSYSQTLIMNEVSNGPSGNKEYVEFIVIDTVVAYNCSSSNPPCIDIRGWIFDDNSGYHGSGGVAGGAVRFSFNPLWSCIPLGTIIVIYNDTDPNPSMPANDISLSDGNCTIITPINNTTLFERNSTTPGAVACSYPATGWIAGGSWSTTVLANPGDCARIVNLAGCEVFSVCWGTNNLNNLIYFNGNGAQNVWYFNNGNPASQVNWTEGAATFPNGAQTPGLPNNAANAAYIAQFNNNCMPITPIQVTATTVNATCGCNGTATAAATGSIPGYTYQWLNANFLPTGQTTATATGLCAGTYNVIATSSIGCSDTATVTLTSISTTTVSVNNESICVGTAATLTATPSVAGGTYSWSPGGQTTQSITVTTAINTTYAVTYLFAGCPVTNTGDVTIIPLPIIAVQDQTVCAGESVTLTGVGATTYTWNNGVLDGVAFIPTNSMNYTVTGTSSNGCIGIDQVSVTVNPLPIVSAGLNQTVCDGEVVTLNGSGALTYSWNLGLSDGVAFIPTITANYTVTGTATNGCTASDQVLVTVHPNPTPLINGPAAYCSGNTAALTTSSPFVTYSWSTGATSPSINATIADSPITVTVTNSFGCSGTSSVFQIIENSGITTDFNVTICEGQSSIIHGIAETVAGVYSQTFILPTGCDSISNVTLIVNPLPLLNAGIDQTLCEGFTATLTANGAATYSWSGGISNGVPFNQLPGIVTYTVTGTSTEGCIITDEAVVTVNPLPIVSAGVDQIICIGTSVTLSGSGAISYEWDNGITDGIQFTPFSSTTYTVIGTDVNGCKNSDNVNLIVNPLPIVGAGNDISICNQQTLTLSATGASVYTWDNGITNGTAFNAPLTTTTYTVTGTSTDGCINTDQVVIAIAPIPVVSFTQDVTSGCVPLTVNFINSTPNVTNCIWTISDGTILTGCGTVTNTFAQAGCFDVTLTTTSANGCVGSLIVNNLICTEESPIASFSQSEFIISSINPIVNFNNSSIGAVDYSWNFGDNTPLSTLVSPSHNYPENFIGNYMVELIAYSEFGCTDTAYSFIQINEELIFYLPNTFTPDGDMFNQTFQPVFTSGFDPYDFTLLIFNRWGEVIFESHNSEIGWDGTYGSNYNQGLVQDGTYTWKIEFKLRQNDERKIVVGHVNLVR
jgi:gliding motility-associated-like protein